MDDLGAAKPFCEYLKWSLGPGLKLHKLSCTGNESSDESFDSTDKNLQILETSLSELGFVNRTPT